jgi:H+-transporting ATPase
MEFAAVLSFALVDYVDGILITGLLLLNACIGTSPLIIILRLSLRHLLRHLLMMMVVVVAGFYEDYSSGNAVAALQAQLAPTCKCLRDGKVQAGTPSVDLVPGDVVLLRLGDVVPADCYLLDDGDSLKIDQSSLTGESLPVNRYPAAEVYSGSIGTLHLHTHQRTRTRTRWLSVEVVKWGWCDVRTVKQGEMLAVVHATGVNTFFGKAASLVQSSKKKSHIHVILKAIGYFCILFVAAGCIAELITQFAIRGKSCTGTRSHPALCSHRRRR